MKLRPFLPVRRAAIGLARDGICISLACWGGRSRRMYDFLHADFLCLALGRGRSKEIPPDTFLRLSVPCS